jgi:uncharacterized iron-regulated membrane protein
VVTTSYAGDDRDGDWIRKSGHCYPWQTHSTTLVRPSQSGARQTPATDARAITPDESVAIARAQMPGAIPYRVQMPRYGGAYRVSLDHPQDRIAGGHNLIVIDPDSGSVISLTQSRDLSSVQRILATSEAIHRGNVFGMPTRIVACLTSVMVSVQVISGLLLWLHGKSSPFLPGEEPYEKNAGDHHIVGYGCDGE